MKFPDFLKSKLTFYHILLFLNVIISTCYFHMKTKIVRSSNLRQKFYCFYFTAVVASEGVCCSRPNRCFTKISQKLSNFYEANVIG